MSESVTAIYEAGTELVIEEEDVELLNGWSEAGGSCISRVNGLVILSLNISNPIPWSAETDYAIGDVVFVGEASYRAIKAGAGHEPTESPTYWEALESPLLVGVLPLRFQPPVDLETAGSYSLKATGEIEAAKVNGSVSGVAIFRLSE